VRSINEIGHLTGKLTIAEFAENAEIINVLRSLGVDYAQGYGIATPQRLPKRCAIAAAPPVRRLRHTISIRAMVGVTCAVREIGDIHLFVRAKR